MLADYFLLHYLSGHPALPLAGTLIHEVLGLSSPTPESAAATARPPRDTLKGTRFLSSGIYEQHCHAEFDSVSPAKIQGILDSANNHPMTPANNQGTAISPELTQHSTFSRNHSAAVGCSQQSTGTVA